MNKKTNPIIKVVKLGDIDGLYQAIIDGFNLHLVDKDGRTSLMDAIINKKIEIVDILLKAGANPNISPYTPLH